MENTHHPKIKPTKTQTVNGMDRNEQLYRSSQQHQKVNKESEDYWYEKQKDECTFEPKITREPFVDKYGNGSVHDIKGI